MIDNGVLFTESLLEKYKVKSKIEMRPEYSKKNDYNYMCNYYKEYKRKIDVFLKDNNFYGLEKNSYEKLREEGEVCLYVVVLECYRSYYLKELDNIRKTIIEIKNSKNENTNELLKELINKQKTGLF